MRTDLHKSSLPLFILCIFYKERAENIITVTGFKIFRMGAAFRRLRKITKSDSQLFLSILLFKSVRLSVRMERQYPH